MSAVLVIPTITLEGNHIPPIETYPLSVSPISLSYVSLLPVRQVYTYSDVPLSTTFPNISKYSLSIAGTGKPVPTRGQLWPPTW